MRGWARTYRGSLVMLLAGAMLLTGCGAGGHTDRASRGDGAHRAEDSRPAPMAPDGGRPAVDDRKEGSEGEQNGDAKRHLM